MRRGAAAGGLCRKNTEYFKKQTVGGETQHKPIYSSRVCTGIQTKFQKIMLVCALFNVPL